MISTTCADSVTVLIVVLISNCVGLCESKINSCWHIPAFCDRVIVKQVMGATMPVHWATWAVSYAALISSCFWDTLVCRVIMEQVELILAVSPAAKSGTKS